MSKLEFVEVMPTLAEVEMLRQAVEVLRDLPLQFMQELVEGEMPEPLHTASNVEEIADYLERKRQEQYMQKGFNIEEIKDRQEILVFIEEEGRLAEEEAKQQIIESQVYGNSIT